MPVRRTSSGKRASAVLTSLLTLKTARSMSVPISNVIVMANRPLVSALELKYSKPSKLCSFSSMGAATVFINVSTFAPGYVAVTITVGGVILGYCSIGNCIAAANPARTMKIDNTDANIGRSIKKRVMAKIWLYCACYHCDRVLE